MIISILSDTSIYFGLALSLWISFRICRYPDLALEHWFVIGGCWFAISNLLNKDYPIIILIIILLLFGFLFGFFCSYLKNKFKINSIIISLCISLILYSIFLLVINNSYILINNFTLPTRISIIILSFIVFGFIILTLWLFSRLKVLNLIIASGCNWELSKRHSLNPIFYQGIGLSIAFIIAMASGALFSYKSLNADLTYGKGQLIQSLFIVIFTMSIQERINIINNAIVLFLTTFIYNGLLNILLQFNVHVKYFQAITACALIGLVLLVNKSNKKVQELGLL